MQKHTTQRLIIAVLGGTLMAACSNQFTPTKGNLASGVDEIIGCKTFEDQLWTQFTAYIETHGAPPSSSEVMAMFDQYQPHSKRLKSLNQKSQAKVSELTSRLAGVISLRNETSPNTINQTSEKPHTTQSPEAAKAFWLERVAQLEIGDQTTKEKAHDVAETRKIFSEFETIIKNNGTVFEKVEKDCHLPPTGGSDASPGEEPNPAPGSPKTLLEHWKATRAAPVYGGLKTFAVAYQSCEAALEPVLDAKTPDVEGIAVVGRHSSGGGNIREISNLKRMIASHPYLNHYKRPLPSCFDILSQPPIYDYGGKPYSSANNERVLNLFKNGGSGSKELGIDCSAFIYSAYGSTGLKLKKETSLKATLINGVSSSMLAEPQKNGLTCLDHVNFNSSSPVLQPGDIIAIRGHVIMVDTVGNDPLGVNRFTSASNCTLANMDVKKFQFTLFQSSPSKGGIGINRMDAKYYLSNTSTMGQGLREHAVNACKSKFSTSTIQSRSTKASIVRHMGGAQCRDTALSLVQEDCLSSCSPSLGE